MLALRLVLALSMGLFGYVYCWVYGYGVSEASVFTCTELFVPLNLCLLLVAYRSGVVHSFHLLRNTLLDH